MSQTQATVKQTYKHADVEEWIDRWWYRPLGFRIARLAARMGVTPNQLTFVGLTIGVGAGHLLYYGRVEFTLIAFALWSLSNTFDSADGQLARMTGQTSQFGRILDGMGGNFVFFSMYAHICFGYALRDGFFGWWIFLIGLAAGASHALQSATADYYRNGYLRFVAGRQKGELDYSDTVAKHYHSLSFRTNFLEKAFYRVYLNYTVQQEKLSPWFLRLRRETDNGHAARIDDAFRRKYRRLNLPLLKYYNYLTINGRVATLFILLLVGYPEVFFFLELTLLNLVLFILLRKQERNNREMYESLTGTGTDVEHTVAGELTW